LPLFSLRLISRSTALRRWRIQQNVTGVIYWLVAWALVGFSPLSIVASASFILDIGSPLKTHPRPAAEWMFLAVVLGILEPSAARFIAF
jgi:hypothetical protein